MTKLKNSQFDNYKTQNVTKFKNLTCEKEIKNSKCDTTQKLKIRQNSKTQNVAKLKKSKHEKYQKLEM